MDLAKNLLKKYGWKEGEGLGKNGNGISEPLRAHMKFDNKGLGTDAATDFNDHWWERCYNDATDNINVNMENNGNVEFKVNDAEDGVEITTKSYSTKKLKKAKKEESKDGKVKYENFLLSSTLTKSGEVINPEKIHLDDIALRSVKILSDDELFKACGGLTAHKGARHVLKLSGKLKRLQEQEEELLAKINRGVNPFQSNAPKEMQSKKKKKKTQKQDTEAPVDDAGKSKSNDLQSSKKTKKRKSEAVAVNKEEEEDKASIEPTTDIQTKKKKKKKSNESESPDITASKTDPTTTSAEDGQEIKKQKKTKKSREKE